jgi:hypothetical protein
VAGGGLLLLLAIALVCLCVCRRKRKQKEFVIGASFCENASGIMMVHDQPENTRMAVSNQSSSAGAADPPPPSIPADPLPTTANYAMHAPTVITQSPDFVQPSNVCLSVCDSQTNFEEN